MASAVKIALIFVVFALASVGWLILGAVTEHRSEAQGAVLDEARRMICGEHRSCRLRPSSAPSGPPTEKVKKTALENGAQVEVERLEPIAHSERVGVEATRVDVELRSDLSRKGLMWYSLYDVAFRGAWRYEHRLAIPTQRVVVASGSRIRVDLMTTSALW